MPKTVHVTIAPFLYKTIKVDNVDLF